ncbi:bacillithiol biosynthesis cysteine-adding enzyme BshC [Virgibacillus natechei]|uniref:Putative cysteine ligase BshC n=1 Tax=Virgibacillus natechei TaxID=1216297 RepID=A0ABS4IBC7_9BACI|nr:bacillithiol biosynthesis cysteine-adding enzyme BshC [Virgibacillus natechei]MBP1968203.1 bacillithiol biosynthesis cysteine-adding enzyme BshC [Virgibacillus natechei]UZD14525.1 bacillithiol biosynthesis cysteine-adding enzyme BshC [Virgibacillus natechei]
MQVDPIHIHKQSNLIADYRNNENNIGHFFDYRPFNNFKERLNDLAERHFDRKQLTDVLYRINQHWDAPESTYHNIERLKENNSVVVIGGQQAGLMTGPMYTINKIISIIQLAKQQEAEFKIPVIPVFWIAGEDHDFSEINHIFLPETSKMTKHKILQRVFDKSSVSDIHMDKTHSSQWLNELFEQLKETQYTKGLYETIKTCLDKSATYVDFFAHLIYQVFSEEGLVLIDSAHPEVRELESKHFVQMIEQQPEISEGVHAAYSQLKQEDYSLPLEVESNEAHLFYHKNNERILLMRNAEGDWVGKQNEVLLSTEELITIAKEQPNLLSNNVVTRPLMQELLFPSLAFIGGPGEISYWAVLKPAFGSLQMKMPPVVPRLSITYVDRSVEKALKAFDISAAEAVNQGVEGLKNNWLVSKNDPPVQQIVDEIKQSVDKAHKPLRDIAQELRSDLGELADKNLQYLHGDIEYLEDRIVKTLEGKYAKELYEFDLIHNALRPHGGLQERIWNPLPWINEYGIGFIRDVANESYSLKNDHYLVYI